MYVVRFVKSHVYFQFVKKTEDENSGLKLIKECMKKGRLSG